MQTFLAILLIALMLATLAMLVRGVIVFLQNETARVKSGESADGPSAASIKSNQLMQKRIMFQALALLVAVLLLLLFGRPS
jgi:hypothetical protein